LSLACVTELITSVTNAAARCQGKRKSAAWDNDFMATLIAG